MSPNPGQKTRASDPDLDIPKAPRLPDDLAPASDALGSDALGSDAPGSWPARPDPVPRGGPRLFWRILGLVRLIRPHQWVKNVFVLAPVVFAKEIFEVRLLTTAGLAFLVFCFLAGAVYTINDLADVAADRLHPVKRFRPIASGRVPESWAKVYAGFLVVGSVGGAAAIDLSFGAVALTYFGLNIAYTLRLKHVAYLDVMCIAAGFVLRVVGGGLATHIPLSGYLYACTALLALFLGFGKRRHEISTAARLGKTRQALEGYSQAGLDRALVISAVATVLAYLLYTLDAQTLAFFHATTLWPTTAFVVVALFRFLDIVKNRPKAESPTQEMLSDGLMVGTVLLWVAVVFWLVYHLAPTP